MTIIVRVGEPRCGRLVHDHRGVRVQLDDRSRLARRDSAFDRSRDGGGLGLAERQQNEVPRAPNGAEALRFAGEPRQFVSKSARGGDATRNFCGQCGGLVFGGVIGESASFTIYAGSLDDATAFKPAIAIFAASRPDWAVIPEGLTVFDRMPG